MSDQESPQFSVPSPQSESTPVAQIATAESAAPAQAAKAKPLTAEEQRKAAIAAYHAAGDRKAKGAVVRQYPVLKEIFSAANHD